MRLLRGRQRRRSKRSQRWGCGHRRCRRASRNGLPTLAVISIEAAHPYLLTTVSQTGVGAAPPCCATQRSRILAPSATQARLEMSLRKGPCLSKDALSEVHASRQVLPQPPAGLAAPLVASRATPSAPGLCSQRRLARAFRRSIMPVSQEARRVRPLAGGRAGHVQGCLGVVPHSH